MKTTKTKTGWRVYRCGRGSGKEQVNFFVYDPDQPSIPPEDELKTVEHLRATQGEEGVRRFQEIYERSGRKLWGRAYGRRFVAEFTVFQNGEIKFAMDNEIHYTEEQLKTLIRLSKSARRRLSWANPSTDN